MTNNQHAWFGLISVSAIAAATILGVQWMDLTAKRPAPEVRVDTIYSITHDTVVSQARDTMKVVVREVGPLTEQILARLICGDQVYGDKKRDHFGLNLMGMIACPRNGLR